MKSIERLKAMVPPQVARTISPATAASQLDELPGIEAEIEAIPRLLDQIQVDRNSTDQLLQAAKGRLADLLADGAPAEVRRALREEIAEYEDTLIALDTLAPRQRERLKGLSQQRAMLLEAYYMQEWGREMVELIRVGWQMYRHACRVMDIRHEAHQKTGLDHMPRTLPNFMPVIHQLNFGHEAFEWQKFVPKELGDLIAAAGLSEMDLLPMRDKGTGMLLHGAQPQRPQRAAPRHSAAAAAPVPTKPALSARGTQPAPKQRERRPSIEVPDGVEVTVLKPGYEAPNGESCRAGDRIIVSRETARAAAVAGAVEIVRSPDGGSAAKDAVSTEPASLTEGAKQ